VGQPLVEQVPEGPRAALQRVVLARLDLLQEPSQRSLGIGSRTSNGDGLLAVAPGDGSFPSATRSS